MRRVCDAIVTFLTRTRVSSRLENACLLRGCLSALPKLQCYQFCEFLDTPKSRWLSHVSGPNHQGKAYIYKAISSANLPTRKPPNLDHTTPQICFMCSSHRLLNYHFDVELPKLLVHSKLFLTPSPGNWMQNKLQLTKLLVWPTRVYSTSAQPNF